jgi:hypothetical protein
MPRCCASPVSCKVSHCARVQIPGSQAHMLRAALNGHLIALRRQYLLRVVQFLVVFTWLHSPRPPHRESPWPCRRNRRIRVVLLSTTTGRIRPTDRAASWSDLCGVSTTICCMRSHELADKNSRNIYVPEEDANDFLKRPSPFAEIDASSNKAGASFLIDFVASRLRRMPGGAVPQARSPLCQVWLAQSDLTLWHPS